MNVFNNVAYPLQVQKLPKNEIRERVAKTLSFVQLDGFESRPATKLSGGQQQRVALAPKVLFLDEPTSGLDPVAARDVHELIDDLRKRGVTIVLTTHRLEEAERLCDRVAILNTTLQTIGRPEELRDRLFTKSLTVRTAAPLTDPAAVFGGLAAVDGWRADGEAGYVLTVSDTSAAAPAAVRALVHAGADVLSIGESRHSLEDVYLQLIDTDKEASRS
jgi:ABC-2 type transport system ATP-binding protein